ncbi:heavy-metal-associated domain-containing protein [Nocardioides rotundus]|uniref:heavy-metal-associated domain-containing protein n=1 Tax=Nocardioides rotundus TaxID=1774216 RepID=UPI001CBF53CB|nr:heavy metal-associated domain-containing protein [Nocardioides rotundus]UAL29195.1 heavy-metal-associated domain-containing protein [Nocardioides rotundus]
MSTTQTYIVNGMTCQSCAASVSEELSEVPGVEGVEVDVETGEVVVRSEAPLDRAAVKSAVDEAGYQLV